MSNALKVLIDDHLKVKTKFQQFGGVERDLALDICDDLTIHAELEEKLLYPALEEVDKDMASHSEEEHQQVKQLIEKVRNLPHDDFEQLRGLMLNIKSALMEHVEEEERSVFPKLEQALGADRLEELGQEIFRLRQQLMGSDIAAQGGKESGNVIQGQPGGVLQADSGFAASQGG